MKLSEQLKQIHDSGDVGFHIEGLAEQVETLEMEVEQLQERVDSTIGESNNYDHIAINMFAEAMREKMDKKRREGRGGWHDKRQCSEQFLNSLLCEHLVKGDPVDVANIAMML